MAYEKGEVDFRKTTDGATPDYLEGDFYVLPHSCDDWVIGTKEQAEQLIADLQALFKENDH